MSSYKVSVANVLNVDPCPISCLALNENTLKAALFRGGSSPAIEIWDVSHMPFLELRLVNLDKIENQASVESIVWAQNRLFSCGLHGFVIEHDLKCRNIAKRTAATSGPVWCLGVHPEQTYIAAGTEDGFVNIFQLLENEDLIYIKVLDRQDGRVLCLSWSPCGKFISTGSVDSLRLWDVEKGHAVTKLLTGRTKNTETIVWSILLLPNFIIVSGDSRGILSFWDGRIGVLRHKVNSHKADILTLKLSSDKSTIYASGVDPVVVLFSSVGRTGEKYVKSHTRFLHSNDVTCLGSLGNRLFSAGIDSDLVVSSYPPKIVVKIPQLPQSSSIKNSRGTRELFVQNYSSVEIWRVPQNMTQELVKILELKTSQNSPIISSSQISYEKMMTFAYSTSDKIRLFSLDTSSTTIPKLRKCGSFETEEIYSNLHFITKFKLIAFSVSSLIFLELVPIDNEQDFELRSHLLSCKDLKKFGRIVCSDFSNKNYVALSNSYGSASVLTLDEKNDKIKSIDSVPSYSSIVTSLALHPSLKILLISYADHNVRIWDYGALKIIYEDKIKSTEPLYPILGSNWDALGQNGLLYSADSLFLLEIDEERGEIVRKKRGKLENIKENEMSFRLRRAKENKIKWIGGGVFIGDGSEREILVVEVKPNSIIEKLPPAFAKKRFGM